MCNCVCWNEPSYKDAFRLAIIGCILEFFFTFAGIAAYFWYGSALCLVYGLENLVDYISSVVVLWRFYAPGSLTKEREQILEQREERANVMISFVIILMGISVLAAAIGELKNGNNTLDEAAEDGNDEAGVHVLVTIAFLSIWIFSVMAIWKLHYARKLKSESLQKDGLCSLIGVALSIAIFSNSVMLKKQQAAVAAEEAAGIEHTDDGSFVPDIQDLELTMYDAMFAIFCGIVALIIGIHGLITARCYQGLPICSWSWWSGSSNMEVEITNTNNNQRNLHHDALAEPTKLSSEMV